MDEIINLKKTFHNNTKCSCGHPNYYLCQCNFINGSLDPYPQEIFPGIFLGSLTYALDDYFINNNHIEFILNCAEEYHKYSNKEPHYSINYLTLNAYDFNDYPIIKNHGQDAFEFIETALMLGCNVYIHCQMGINRSATLLAYVIYRFSNKPMKECIIDIIKKRPICFSNKSYIQQLLDIEEGKILI